MAVNLGNLTLSLDREVNPPGEELFPNATDDTWIGYLTDAFWECRLHGMLSSYTCDDAGLVTPLKSGAPDLGRDLQQLVVFYAGYKSIRNRLLNLKTAVRQSAGPVTYETQQSAQVLRDVLADFKQRLELVLSRLSDVGSVTTDYIDGVLARDQSILAGDTRWVAAGVGQSRSGRSGDPYQGF